jgi:hypothetical protein
MGSAISALAAGFIVFYQDSYRAIFLFTIIPYVLDMFLIMSYPGWLDGEKERPGWHQVRQRFQQTGRDFVVTFRSLERIRAVMNVAVYSGFYKAGRDYLQAVIKNLAPLFPLLYGLNKQDKISIIVGGSYFIIYSFSSVASRKSGSFAELFRRVSLPLNITLIAGLSMGALAGVGKLSGLPWLAILPFVVVILLENLRKPLGVSHIAEKTEPRVHASVLSAQSQMKSLIAALIAVALGFFSDRFGVGYALMIVSGLLILLLPLYSARNNKTKT